MSYFEINNLRIDHHSFEGTKTVLDIEHLAIEKGETYGLVGESGQGKTVLALAVQKLLRCPRAALSPAKFCWTVRTCWR